MPVRALLTKNSGKAFGTVAGSAAHREIDTLAELVTSGQSAPRALVEARP